MASSMWHFVGWISLVVGFIGAIAVDADGQEFRVDTEVFQNQDKKPILEQLTIFAADGTIYDLRLTDPQEVTVFDLRRGVCTLLDESRQVKATVTTQELLQFNFNLERTPRNRRIRCWRFAPKFETTEKEINNNGQTTVEVRLFAKPLVYVAEGNVRSGNRKQSRPTGSSPIGWRGSMRRMPCPEIYRRDLDWF